MINSRHSSDELSLSPKYNNQRAMLHTSFRRKTVDDKDAQKVNAQFGTLAITSNVSQTESKLIIALKKQLLEAKALLENEHNAKLKLIEGARNLKR